MRCNYGWTAPVDDVPVVHNCVRELGHTDEHACLYGHLANANEYERLRLRKLLKAEQEGL